MKIVSLDTTSVWSRKQNLLACMDVTSGVNVGIYAIKLSIIWTTSIFRQNRIQFPETDEYKFKLVEKELFYVSTTFNGFFSH